MRHVPNGSVEPREVVADEERNLAKNTFVQVLLPEGPNFVLRVFTLKPGGHTPRHSHPWEHGVYVLEGRGRTQGAAGTPGSAPGRTEDAAELDLAPGDAVHVAPNEVHSFVNAGEGDFRFICVIPSGAACLPERDRKADCGKAGGSR